VGKILTAAVAHGMWAYSNAAFRVAVVGPRRLGIEPGTLILVTHRRETDVPVLCPPLYHRGELRRQPVAFAARDDMFLPGFFAGFPPELPVAARRALFGVGVARWLPRVGVFPIRSASVARLGETFPGREAEPLPDPQPFAARARELGLPEPRRVADVVRGEYADLLWRPVTPAELPSDGFWSRRAAEAAEDFRRLVGLVRAGTPLVLFPEGRPSPDGEIGPVQRGLSALVRRGRPPTLLPLGLGYDPLTSGRTRVVVAFGRPVPPDPDEEAALALLRRAVPLTAGQLVAAGVDFVDALDRPRLVDPVLLDPESRRRRMEEARRAAEARPDELPFLRREFESAREG
jgi:1-acyl-sn-glycerol-3-phosphate acyltransferase